MTRTVGGLHHIALGSADVERLAAFYRDVVGLAELGRHVHDAGGLRSVWLDLGGAILMIEHTDEQPRRVEHMAAGPFLLAFRVTSSERSRLESVLGGLGIVIESRTAFTSYARDVDGNRLAFSHHPEVAPPVASGSTG